MSYNKKEICDGLERTLDLIDNAFDYGKALKRTNQTQENVNFLRQLVKSVDIIPKSLHDKQLLCFLDVSDNAEGAVKLATNYYEIKKNGPELFANRNFELPEIKQCLANQTYISLPLTPNNECVIFHSLSNTVAKNYVFDEAVKTFVMLAGEFNAQLFVVKVNKKCMISSYFRNVIIQTWSTRWIHFYF